MFVCHFRARTVYEDQSFTDPGLCMNTRTVNRQPEDCEPDSVWVQNHRLGSESQTSLSIHGPTQKRQEHNGIFKPFTSDKQYDLGFHRQIYQYS